MADLEGLFSPLPAHICVQAQCHHVEEMKHGGIGRGEMVRWRDGEKETQQSRDGAMETCREVEIERLKD